MMKTKNKNKTTNEEEEIIMKDKNNHKKQPANHARGRASITTAIYS